MDYAQYIKETERLYLNMLAGMASAGSSSGKIPLLGPKPLGSGPQGEPVVMIVSPHPDDECIMGSYAFRMKLEWNAIVLVFPFTFGSNEKRRDERAMELADACAVLDFEIVPEAQLEDAIREHQPDFVFSPHAEDGHPAHVRAHESSLQAMQAEIKRNPAKKFQWLQTEFWHAMKAPNLLIPLSADHVTLMGLALMKHRGEVARNPYHLRLPAWYMDQVRRGSEQVAGMGTSGRADWVFGQLYLKVELSGADVK